MRVKINEKKSQKDQGKNKAGIPDSMENIEPEASSADEEMREPDEILENSQVDAVETGPEEETGGSAFEELNSKVSELEEMLALERDKRMRLIAEYDNYRRRTQSDFKSITEAAGERIILKLLPVIDDFDRLFAQDLEKSDCEGLLQGMKLIARKFVEILGSEGLKPMKSVGEEFDAEIHEAVAQISDGNKPSGEILVEAEKGYMLYDKIIRHPKVVVNAVPESTPESADE